MKPSERQFPIGRLGRVGVLATTLLLTLLAVLPLRAQRLGDAAQSAGNERADMNGAANERLAPRHAGDSAKRERHEKSSASVGNPGLPELSGSTIGTSLDGSASGHVP